MEEKKQLKKFKCLNPDCGIEFLADEFEALECPACHTEGIAPLRPPLTKYFGIGALVVIVIVLIILFFRGCSADGTKLELQFVLETCELKAIVDDKENQSYVYVLDSKVIQFEKSTFKQVGIGNHTVCIFNKDNFEPNSNQNPIVCKPIFVPKSCDGNPPGPDTSGGVSPQFLRISYGKGGIGLVIIYSGPGPKDANYEFSISGIKGVFQNSPEFPKAKCKLYQPYELVVRCIDRKGKGYQDVFNLQPVKFDGCIKINPPDQKLPDSGDNQTIKKLFDDLINGSSQIGDSYGINPGDMSDPIQIYHNNKSAPEIIPFYDYMVRLKADKTITINKVSSAFKWGTDAKGKQVPVPINIKVYEAN